MLWFRAWQLEREGLHRVGALTTGLFHEPQKEQTAASGVAAIEAKGEFVEIGIQILRGDRPLMGAQQPAFEQRGNAMDCRQANVSRIPLLEMLMT